MATTNTANENKPKGTVAYAFGAHPVNGNIVKSKTVGSGNFAQTTIWVVLGEGVWEALDAVYWNGELLSPLNYHFHRGNLSDGMDVDDDPDTQGLDSWNTDGQTYSGKAYVIVKLPVGVEATADFTNLKMICRCKRVPDFNELGELIAFSYSTNPARCLVDVLLNKFKISPERIDWNSYIQYRDFCDVMVDWEEGVAANRPNWQEVPASLIENQNGGFRKSNGASEWTAVKTLSVFSPIAPNFGFFEVEVRQGQTAFGYVDATIDVEDLDSTSDLHSGFICLAADAEATSGTLKITNNGAEETVGTWSQGDKLKVKLKNNAATFYKNNVLIAHTLLLEDVSVDVNACQMLYFVDSLTWSSQIAPLNSGTVAGTNTPTWINMNNISVINIGEASVKKTAGGLGWNAGAVTSNTIPYETEGWIEFKAGNLGTFIVGFTELDRISSKTQARFGIQLQNSHSVQIVRDGVDIVYGAGTWATGDVFKLYRFDDGSYEVWKNGSLYFTKAQCGGATDAHKIAVRGAFASYDQNCYIEDVTYSHVGNNLRQRKRFECGLAFTGNVDAAVIVQSILYVSCATMQDVDGKLIFIPPSMLGAEREPTFTFDMGNIKSSTFKAYRTPRDQKPTLIEGIIRDLDTAYLKEATVPVHRDELADLIGRTNEGGEIYLGTITQGQASCVLNYHTRLNVDLDLFCSFDGSPETYPVAVGDIVDIYHDVPEWSAVKCIVMEAFDLSSLNTADERRFLLKQFHQEIYSDTDQTALNSDVTYTETTTATPPPPLRTANLLIQTVTLPDGNLSWDVYGDVMFEQYPLNQRAKIYVSTPSVGIPTFTGIILTPDENNAASFIYHATEAGIYGFTFITENEAGVTRAWNEHLYVEVEIDVASVPLFPPTNYTGVFAINTITHRWTPPTVNPNLVAAYEIWSDISNLNDLTKRVFRGLATSYTENFAINSNPPSSVNRWIRSVDNMGNVSAWALVNGSGSVPIITVGAVSGHSLYYDGLYLIHTWTPNPQSQNIAKYELSSSPSFIGLVGESDSNSFAERITSPASSYTRYIRAVDRLGNAGPASLGVTLNVVQLAAPTLTRNTNMSFPSAVGFNITPPGGLDRNQVMRTIVEVSNSAGFGTIIATIPSAGVVESVFITGQVTQTPTIYVRARYESSSQAGLNSNIGNWTFTTFGSGDIGSGQIFDLHIRDVNARKIIAEEADFGLIFTNQLVSQDYAPHQPQVVRTERVTWRNLVGAAVVTDENGLLKDGGGDAWNAGASSNRSIHRGNGYAEFIIKSISSTQLVSYGLSVYEGSSSYTEPFASIVQDNDSIVVYQSGSAVFTAYNVLAVGDILKIAIIGTTVKYYLNGQELYSSSPTIKYPAVVDVALMRENAVTGIATISGVLETTPIADTIWANRTGCDVIANNVLRKHVTLTDAWGDCGASSGDAGVGVSCFAEAVWDGTSIVAFGLGPQNINGYEDIYYCIVPTGSGMFIYNSGTLVTSDVPSVVGDRMRVAHYNGVIYYYRNGVLIHSHAWTVGSTLHYNGAIKTPNGTLTDAKFSRFGTGKGWRLHPQYGSNLIGVGEFNDNVQIKDAMMNDVMVRSMNAIGADLRIRGNDTTKVPVAKITPLALNSMFVNADNSIDVELTATISGYDSDADSQSDSVRRARVTIIDKFGTIVKTVETPFFGVGNVLSTRHSRKYADAIEEAIYKIEVYNHYGYSLPVYFNKGARTTTFPALGNPQEHPRDASCAALSDTEVRVSWTAATTNAGNQTVKYRQLGNTTWLDATTSQGSTVGSYIITGLASNLEYEVKVGNNSVAGAFSNICLTKTLSTASSVPTFQPPSGLSGNAPAYNQIVLNWVRNSATNDAVDVEIDGAVTQLGATAVTHTHNSLTAESTHTYRVRNSFSSNANKSAWTNLINVTTPPQSNPNDPSNLHSTGSTEWSVSLAWSENGSTGAEIDWRIYGQSGWTNTPLDVAAGVDDYVFSGLSANTGYEFRVRNDNGTNPSNTILAYTLEYEDPDPQCVLLRTLVLVWLSREGRRFVWKRACDITLEDVLVGIAPDGRPYPARIRHIYRGKTSRIYSLLTENGKFLECSPSHPIVAELVSLKVAHAYALRVGNPVLTFNETMERAAESKIAAVEFTDLVEPMDVVTFEMMSNSHTLVTAEIVSHNRDQKL